MFCLRLPPGCEYSPLCSTMSLFNHSEGKLKQLRVFFKRLFHCDFYSFQQFYWFSLSSSLPGQPEFSISLNSSNGTMAAAALVTENFKFVSLFFKSKDVMMFNGLIALGTVAGQTVYNVFAFDCPCSPGRNYLYGLAAIGVPALVFFLVGIMFNKNTWDMVSECRLRRCRKLSGAAVFALIGSVFGRAVVAPLTWVVISLLQGQAYTCALSEFVNSTAIRNFPTDNSLEVLAKLPCEDIPANMKNVKTEIHRQLKYESQVLMLYLELISF